MILPGPPPGARPSRVGFLPPKRPAPIATFFSRRRPVIPVSRSLLASIVLLFLSAGAQAADLPDPIRRFIDARCIECHDADSARAGFRIDLLTDDFTAGNNADLWKEVMDQINAGKMPPKTHPRPDA